MTVPAEVPAADAGKPRPEANNGERENHV